VEVGIRADKEADMGTERPSPPGSGVGTQSGHAYVWKSAARQNGIAGQPKVGTRFWQGAHALTLLASLWKTGLPVREWRTNTTLTSMRIDMSVRIVT
jgi:hypothetical protein